MATIKDLTEVQAQIEERVGHLREGFGVLETDFAKLKQEDQGFKIDLDHTSHSQLQDVLTQDMERLQHLEHDAVTHFETTLRPEIQHLTEDFQEAKTTLTDHVAHHQDAHHALQQEMVAFAGDITQADGELDHAKQEFLGQVTQMATELHELGEKAFATGGELATSIQDTQVQIIDKAAAAFKDLLGNHIDSLLPGHFEQTMANLTHAVSDLASQCNTVGTAFQHELETLLHDVSTYATQEVHDKIQEKFQNLIHEAVAFLLEQITESIAATTAGAAITGAMAPILPELAVLKAATEIIKEAIEVLKALEHPFGL